MKNRSRFYKVIILVLMAAIAVFMTVVAVSQYREDTVSEKQFEEISKEVECEEESNIVDNLKIKNEDVVGYLEIPDTTISYPVMQTKNEPDFYLNHDINKEYSFYGTPYLSAYCDLEKSDNLIIYGHNINGGRMFGALMQYKDEKFFRKHQYIYFLTDKKIKYEIFAVMSVDINEFPFYEFVMAKDKDDYNKFVDKVKVRSIDKTDVTPEYGQGMITLSTCDSIWGDSYRFVIMAVYRVKFLSVE